MKLSTIRLLSLIIVLASLRLSGRTPAQARVQVERGVARYQQAGSVFIDEPFDTDVFSGGDWERTDDSVTVDSTHGWLHIATDYGNGDYANKSITSPLPIIVETRMRLVSDGRDYTLPALEFYYDLAAMPIGITYVNGDGGWLFGISPNFTRVRTHGPGAENTWTTVRAVIRQNGGDLYAKFDGEANFTFVTASTFLFPGPLIQVKLRQHWDSTNDIDYLTISAEPPHVYLPVTIKSIDEALMRYILADIQLGGPIDDYRQIPDDRSVTEAVRRWDAGVRAVNIDRFERKFMGIAGWRVIYVGTDTTIDGMDVILTTDPQSWSLAR